MTVEQSRIEPRALHHGRRDRARKDDGEWRREADVRRRQEREADVVHRPRDAAGAGLDVRARLELPAGNQRLGRAVVVADVEIAVEGDRVGDGEIVRLVAGSGERAVRDQSPQHENDDRLQRAAGSASRRHDELGPQSTAPRRPGRVRAGPADGPCPRQIERNEPTRIPRMIRIRRGVPSESDTRSPAAWRRVAAPGAWRGTRRDPRAAPPLHGVRIAARPPSRAPSARPDSAPPIREIRVA